MLVAAKAKNSKTHPPAQPSLQITFGEATTLGTDEP
jgi:hypothetical protein